MPVDPLRLFDSQSIEGAALYAKRVASDTADLYPVLVDEAGNLCINMTVGTVSLSSTASTITNAVGNPVPVSLTSTVVTTHFSPSASVVTVHISPSGSLATVALSSTRVTVTLISGQTAIDANTGAVGAGTPRFVQANNAGKTLTSTTVSLSGTNTTIVVAGTNRIKVYAFSITTTSTTSAICKFQSGTGAGLDLWSVLLQAPSGANAGANLSVAPPAFLFATASAAALRLNMSTAIPGEVSVSYYDEA